MALALLVRIAVPALVALGLTAAYLVFGKRQTEDEHSNDGGGTPSRHQFRSHDETENPRSTDGTQPRRRPPNRTENLEECKICMEERPLVELYPCNHQSMCESCVVKIISKSSRACPFCRRRIQGYRDA
ncbi:hypothetical protein EGW08_007262 [Elysia chlorotica]|uniref:RING-type domain-containing protein n=1 Tax=Elysia chlorotica TaxID=188477 RepID=A0A433TTS6_ELYCH|nr:hypothetical protein EGW08_007262 [Elysia chlorotica]